ncbi:MAG: DUF2497 domain-containing protein [Pseudomonadota bacterium]
MSDNNTPDAEEPSIEEILASIRQIISDDDEEGSDAETIETAAEEPAPEPEVEDDVLDLTEEMEVEDEVEVDFVDSEMDAVDTIEEDEPVFASDPEPERSFEPTPSSILSDNAQAATMSSLSKLVGNVPLNRRGYDGVTLEDIVRELLHPMLRDWMDVHLPPLVERTVQKELEKLARRAMDD